MVYAVIMAGGSGTRFWPASRKQSPKQLLSISGQQTLLEAAVARLDNLVAGSDTLVVTNHRLVDAVRALLPNLPPTAILGEPAKRDTTACIALAAGLLNKRDPNATMLVIPADHLIKPIEEFQHAVKQGVELVNADPSRLVTFGIKPSYAAESFGYIRQGNSVSAFEHQGDDTAFEVHEFCEKPDQITAQRYLDHGDYYWNSGIFVWRTTTILKAIEENDPALMEHINVICNAYESPEFEEIFQHEFSAIKGRSIDYTVLETHDNVVIIPTTFEWNDVGSWQSIQSLFPVDENNNTIIAKHIYVESTNNIVWTSEKHLVATVGIHNCIIVHTADATLIANKDDEESVREVVALLKSLGWESFL
ncbi:MAG: mannose-1-phosphate guanylyltransferase [Planctomycetaceae bacterium]|nr:mannose-1-phosphate guanylyltransferase [Planctomycetaceae bacterium]